jgi:hypothetical protein
VRHAALATARLTAAFRSGYDHRVTIDDALWPTSSTASSKPAWRRSAARRSGRIRRQSSDTRARSAVSAFAGARPGLCSRPGHRCDRASDPEPDAQPARRPGAGVRHRRPGAVRPT